MVSARDGFVVMDDEDAVRRGVDVELHGVGPEGPRGAEGGERVLDFARRCAAVRDDECRSNARQG